VKFSELVRILEKNGFSIIKEKGSIRYYGKLTLINGNGKRNLHLEP
jgi:predicted RNA binding protein YcfA (HicA-like mRNA interferase family)